MGNTPNVFAFGFANLAMLGWLAAAAAPLLIHLWSRHRHREAPWAAMQFLLAAMQKNARRLRLHQWLLLAVRTLIIVLAVLAVAEPTSERLQAGGGSTPMHHVLVLDASYSMGYRTRGMSAFQRAKQLALAVVRDRGPADSFTVIHMGSPAQKIVGREVVDQASVVAEIEALAQEYAEADLAGALRLVEESVSGRGERPSRSVRSSVYFFSDLQRRTWELGSSTRPGQASTERERISAIASQAAVHILDVGPAESANLAVTRLAAAEAYATLEGETGFEARLRQFGERPRARCAIELLIDEVPVAEQRVDVPAGGETTVRFAHRFQSPGSHVVSVRAAGDDLPVDDARWLVVPVQEEVRVLCVAGREGAARHVARALRPSAERDSSIRPVVVSEGDLADLPLADFDCLFLCNVAQFTPSEAQRLHRYAAGGGGMVVFLGDRVVAENYNRYTADVEDAADRGRPALLPARLEELATQPQAGIDPLDYDHPIVAPFRGRERAGLLTTPVGRYIRLAVPPGRPGVRVAAATTNGDPLIVTAPVGQGQLVLVATAGSLESVDTTSGAPWTQWPTWPSFLPIVRESLAYAMGGQQQQWQQAVGAPLGGMVPAGRAVDGGTASLQIVRPDGRADAISMQPAPTGLQWSYHATDRSGIYTLRGVDGEPKPFAVNVDAAEGDLAKVDPRQFPAQISVGAAPPQVTRGGERGGIYASRDNWSVSLLWSCLALLFVESFLAWMLGRGVV